MRSYLGAARGEAAERDEIGGRLRALLESVFREAAEEFGPASLTVARFLRMVGEPRGTGAEVLIEAERDQPAGPRRRKEESSHRGMSGSVRATPRALAAPGVAMAQSLEGVGRGRAMEVEDAPLRRGTIAIGGVEFRDPPFGGVKPSELEARFRVTLKVSDRIADFDGFPGLNAYRFRVWGPSDSVEAFMRTYVRELSVETSEGGGVSG